MRRLPLLVFVAVFFLSVPNAYAANTINWTFYGPGAGGRMQGSMQSASRDAEGASNIIKTLDDVRTGKSKYVTLASASVMKGRYYCIGTVTYTSPPTNGGDGKTHTLQNVVGYVHDTGCAFNGTCSCAFLAQFCDGRARTDKMDIAVGNFTGYDGGFAMNYITKNPNRAPASWTQIAGLPQQSASQNPLTPCGGQVKEEGTPTAAPYSPQPGLAPAPQPGSQTRPVSSPTQTQPQQTPYQAQSVSTGGTAGSSPISSGGVASNGSLTVPQPNQGGYPTSLAPQPSLTYPLSNSTNTILSSLFQNVSATSGIRSIQNAAQSFVDMLTVPAHATQGGSVLNDSITSANNSSGALNETDVSLMNLSLNAENVALPVQTVNPPSPIPDDVSNSRAVKPQETTFSPIEVRTGANGAPIAEDTRGAFSYILSALQSILASMLQLFGGR